MYSTKTAIESTGSAFMNAGINDNVTLNNVEVTKSPTGKDFIRFTFADADGKTAEWTEWKNEKNMYIKQMLNFRQKIIVSLVVFFRYLNVIWMKYLTLNLTHLPI